MKNHLFLAFSVLLLISCSPNFPDIEEKDILKHIKILASDEFEGRAPATLGEEKTVAYIQKEFETLGLKTGFGESYIQNVPVTAYLVDKSSTMSISTKGNTTKLSYYNDFMAWPSNNEPNLDFKKIPLVYVGYGIVAPEEDWDDYKGMDVKGKILVFKNSDPYSHPDKFGSKTRLYYGRYTYKYEIAAKLGAAGAIIIHSTPTAGYPWSVVANSWEKQQFKLGGDSEKSPSQINGWITLNQAQELFKAAGLELSTLMDEAENKAFKPIPLNGVSLSASLKTQFDNLTLKNVGGILEGTDANLKNEFVVFSAHHDHLGIGTPVDGDSVFNGAMDNATGISALLNLAALHKESPRKRSLLFLAVGGEEKGLLGSEYYSTHPSIDPAYISANINIDGLNTFGKTKDVASLGLGRTSLDPILQKYAELQGRHVVGDQRPEAGYFYRSDHFNFARIGVPAMYLNRGVEFIDKPSNFVEDVVDKWTITRYHSLKDEIYDAWDLSGYVQDFQLLYSVSRDVADAAGMMRWTPGDEFEAKRLESLKEREK